jgi:transposase
MTNSNANGSEKAREKVLIATVDIGAVKNTGYCRYSGGEDIKVFGFFNNGIGFKKFWSIVNKAARERNVDEIVVGYESTGCYGEPFMHYMSKKKGVRIVQVNPVHTKKLKDLQDNSPNKHDWKDPKVIADILMLGYGLKVIIPEGVYAELRRLTHARERAIKRRTALYNQIQDIMFILLPEFIQEIKKIASKSAIYIVKNCPTKEAIRGYGKNRFCAELRRVSRGQWSKSKIDLLFDVVMESCGVTEGIESMVFELKELVEFTEKSNRFIKELESQMMGYLKKVPYSDIILSIKGINIITAAGIIGEVGDFRNFRSQSELVKLCGLDLYEISSGKHTGERHISKRGRPLLRKLLFFTAINVVKKGGILHDYYTRYVERGKPKMKGLIAVTRKLICIIFAMIRDMKLYTCKNIQDREVKQAA